MYYIRGGPDSTRLESSRPDGSATRRRRYRWQCAASWSADTARGETMAVLYRQILHHGVLVVEARGTDLVDDLAAFHRVAALRQYEEVGDGP